MGLCKCPKRKVTNLFCFEHRVNVCEHCLVSNHSKCIVQSYLNWLQDSDYNPTCGLCQQKLDNENYGDCVRLICYDLYHWSCLNQYAASLPATTAPAGYQCPKCRGPVFPATNVVSPVAEKLRDVLTTVNWARAGLGLPLIEDERIPAVPTHASHNSHSPADQINYGASLTPSISDSSLGGKPTQPVQPLQQSTVGHSQTYNRQTDQSGGMNRMARQPNFPDSASSKPDSHTLNISDHDMDKYKRRSAFTFLSQWFKSRDSKGVPKSTKNKFLMVVVIGLVGFMTIIIIFSKLGRNMAEDDPMLDMMANPNLRVNDG